MNRPLLVTLALICAGGLQAQVAQAPLAETDARHDFSPAPAPRPDYRGGTVIWSEDFSGGFPATWTLQDTSGICPWKHSFFGSAGFFAGTTGPIQSTTAANGFLLCDPDSANNVNYGQPSGTTYQYLPSWFTTGAIDLTGHPFVKLEFEQYFRYNNNPPLYVQVSNDGVSWSTWDVKGTVPANTTSANAQTVGLNISAVAGDQPTVFIRIGWSARVYFWMIDDMRIVPLPDDDLTLSEAFMSRTDADYDDTSIRSLEYSFLPLEQAGSLVVGGSVVNNGSQTATNVRIAVQVLLDGVSQGTFQSPAIASFASGTTDSIYFDTGWTPSSTGRVTLNYTLTSDQTDTNPADNAATRRFRVTAPGAATGHAQMGQDLTAASGTFYGIGTNVTLSSVGNKYEVQNPGSLAYGVAVGLLTGTVVGAQILVELYADDGVNVGLVATSDLFEVEAQHLTAAGDSNMVFIPFNAALSPEPVPTVLDPNFDYVALVTNTGSEEVRVATSGGIRRGGLWGLQTSNSQLVQYIGNGNRATHVRLYLTNVGNVGIEEAGDLGGTLMAPMPNPFRERTSVVFELDSDTHVELLLHDATGRLAQRHDLGHRAAGRHQFDLAGHQLGAGTYSMSLRGEGLLLRRQVVHLR